MLRQRDGHLTRDLLRAPGGFGLGPGSGKAEAGRHRRRGLRLLLDRLQPDHPSQGRRGGQPDTGRRLPRQPRRRHVPKGWEALAVLGGLPIAPPSPLLRDAAGVPRARGLGRCAAGHGRAVQGAPRRDHGPESVAFLSTGQMPTEEMALLGVPGEVRHGHGARRRQHAPMHGHGGRRLQAGVRLRRAALHLPATSSSPTSSSWWAPILCIAHPIMWERVLQQPASIPPSSSSIRG